MKSVERSGGGLEPEKENGESVGPSPAMAGCLRWAVKITLDPRAPPGAKVGANQVLLDSRVGADGNSADFRCAPCTAECKLNRTESPDLYMGLLPAGLDMAVVFQDCEFE